MTRIKFLTRVANTPRGAVRDLSDGRAQHLISLGLAERVAHKAPAPAAPEPIPEISAQEIRDWAAGYGLKCPARGPIPKHLRQAYIDQHYGERT